MSMIWLVAPNSDWSDDLANYLSGVFAVRRIAGLRSLVRILKLDDPAMGQELVCVIHIEKHQDILEAHSVLSSCLLKLRADQICIYGDLNPELTKLVASLDLRWVRPSLSLNELAKSLKSFMTKPRASDRSLVTEDTIRIGDIEVDRNLSLMRIMATGFQEPLTPKEVRILQVLSLAANTTIGRDELVRKVWAGVRVSTSTIDSHMSRLRKKIEQSFECRLETAYGSGWKISIRSENPD